MPVAPRPWYAPKSCLLESCQAGGSRDGRGWPGDTNTRLAGNALALSFDRPEREIQTAKGRAGRVADDVDRLIPGAASCKCAIAEPDGGGHVLPAVMDRAAPTAAVPCAGQAKAQNLKTAASLRDSGRGLAGCMASRTCREAVTPRRCGVSRFQSSNAAVPVARSQRFGSAALPAAKTRQGIVGTGGSLVNDALIELSEETLLAGPSNPASCEDLVIRHVRGEFLSERSRCRQGARRRSPSQL